MHFRRLFFLNIYFLTVILIFFGCTKGHHHHHSMESKVSKSKDNKIHIKEAWIRAVPPASKMAAAYMEIMNLAKDDDKLISVESSISMVAEIHNVKKKDGMMKMVPVSFFKIPGRSQQELKPGGYHIMLIKLHKTLKIGEQYELVLNFKNAKEVKVNAIVSEGSSMKKEMSHDHG